MKQNVFRTNIDQCFQLNRDRIDSVAFDDLHFENVSCWNRVRRVFNDRLRARVRRVKLFSSFRHSIALIFANFHRNRPF